MSMVSDLLGTRGGQRSQRLGLIAALVIGAALAVGALYYSGTVSPSRESAGVATPTRAVVDGFRSAQFGMTEGAVRAAIATDFAGKIGPAADAIKVVENKVERTRILVVRVKDLFPEAGLTEIGYVLGYKSKALMQVNLLWGTPMSATMTPQQIDVIATNLQRYFVGLGFAAKDVKANLKIAKGTMLVFQGNDAKGHLVQLVRRAELMKAATAATDSEKAVPAQFRQTLRLAYIANPKEPDTFQIGKGEF